MPKKSVNYVDNKKLHELIVEWRKEPHVLEWINTPREERDNKNRPHPTDEIIEICWEIVTRNTKQWKWNNIPEDVLEDSTSCAIESCIKYLHNFDASTKTNPFAYVTEISNRAIFQEFNKYTDRIENNTKYLTATGSLTHIRSDGEIDVNSGGEFAQENLKHYEKLLQHSQKDKNKK